jgi:hypothetical protein
MIDLTLLEREIRRILNSHRSMVERTAAADKLFQRVSGLHTAIPDTGARAQFRAAYRDLVARMLGQSPSSLSSNKARLAECFLDHARNLKEVEATKEMLDRELGDF